MEKKQETLTDVAWEMTKHGYLCAVFYMGKGGQTTHRTIRLHPILENKIYLGDNITRRKGDGRYEAVDHRHSHTKVLPAIVRQRCLTCNGILTKITRPISNRKNSRTETCLVCDNDECCTTRKIAMWISFGEKNATGVGLPPLGKKQRLVLHAGYWTPFSFYSMVEYTPLMNLHLSTKEAGIMNKYIQSLPRQMTVSQVLHAMGYPTSSKNIDMIAEHCGGLDKLQQMGIEKIKALDPRYSFTPNELARMKSFWQKTTTKMSMAIIRRHITLIDSEVVKTLKQQLKHAVVYLYTETISAEVSARFKRKLSAAKVTWARSLEDATVVIVDTLKAKRRWEKILAKKGKEIPIYLLETLDVLRHHLLPAKQSRNEYEQSLNHESP